MELKFQVQAKIRKLVSEVFQAVTCCLKVYLESGTNLREFFF